MKLYKLHEARTISEMMDPTATMSTPSMASQPQPNGATEAQVSELTRRIDAIEDTEQRQAAQQTSSANAPKPPAATTAIQPPQSSQPPPQAPTSGNSQSSNLGGGAPSPANMPKNTVTQIRTGQAPLF